MSCKVARVCRFCGLRMLHPTAHPCAMGYDAGFRAGIEAAAAHCEQEASDNIANSGDDVESQELAHADAELWLHIAATIRALRPDGEGG